MRWIVIALLLLTALSGCLRDDDPSDYPGDDSGAAAAAKEPFYVDETFELFPTGMDETWTWSMSPGMTDRTTIEYIPDPIGQGDQSVCYDMSWPQGRHHRCSTGGASIQVSGTDLIQPSTIYDVKLIPNSFNLRVWTGSGPDTADVRVYIETFAAPE